MKKKILALALSMVMMLGALAACGDAGSSSTPPAAGSGTESGTETPTASGAEDTITLLVPPLSTNYHDQLDAWAAEFNALYPNLTLEFEKAGWEDYTEKLEVMVNATTPPDIAYIQDDVVGKWVDTELLMDITNIITPEMLADFDSANIDYFRNGDGLYGMPLYTSVHALGGNRQMMEDAGIDWEKVQKEGWDWEDFRAAIAAGSSEDVYGFIFACAGVTSKDYLSILGQNAGMPSPFTTDLKFAYTDEKWLDLLQCIRDIIDDGSTPKEMSSIDAGMRWNLFLTGQTMIFGKGLANFEGLAVTNNERLATGGDAVENSVEVDYVVLPVPTFFGEKQAAFGATGGYGMFRGKEEPTEEHTQNVLTAMYWLSTNTPAAFTCDELYLSPLSNTTRDLMADITHEPARSDSNADAMALLTSQIAPARPDIPADLMAKYTRLQDEVIVPKFQALLANETTPQEMYDTVKAAAIEVFGEDGVV